MLITHLLTTGKRTKRRNLKRSTRKRRGATDMAVTQMKRRVGRDVRSHAAPSAEDTIHPVILTRILHCAFIVIHSSLCSITITTMNCVLIHVYPLPCVTEERPLLVSAQLRAALVAQLVKHLKYIIGLIPPEAVHFFCVKE